MKRLMLVYTIFAFQMVKSTNLNGLTKWMKFVQSEFSLLNERIEEAENQTKSDIERIQSDLSKVMTDTKTEIDRCVSRLQTDIQGNISDINKRMQRWKKGTVGKINSVLNDQDNMTNTLEKVRIKLDDTAEILTTTNVDLKTAHKKQYEMNESLTDIRNKQSTLSEKLTKIVGRQNRVVKNMTVIQKEIKKATDDIASQKKTERRKNLVLTSLLRNETRTYKEISDIRLKQTNLEELLTRILRQQNQTIERINKLTEELNQRPTSLCGAWERYDLSCYKLFTEQVAWEVAVEKCKSKNAHLVEIDNEKENIFIKGLSSFQEEQRPVWIGASDRQSEGDWVWISSGRHLNSTFEDWADKMPDNRSRKEHCLDLSTQFKEKWNDAPCHNEFSYIYERYVHGSYDPSI